MADLVFGAHNLKVEGTIGVNGVAPPAAQSAALTPADGGTVDTTWGQDEVDVVTNLVTRQAEIEAILVAYGLAAEAE